MAMTGDESRESESESVDRQLGMGSRETKITQNTIPKNSNLFLNHHRQTSAETSQTKFPIKVSEIGGESNSKVKIESPDDEFKKFDEMIKGKVDEAKTSAQTSKEESLKNSLRSREAHNEKGPLRLHTIKYLKQLAPN